MKINVLWQPNDVIALALSGGVDSVVLFDLLITKYRDSYKELIIYHVNHGLRKESSQEAFIVERLARKNNVKFYKEDLNLLSLEKSTHVSEEMLARSMRYEAFKKFSQEQKIDAVITAHHKNDSVENILMRIFMGRGADYNLAIAPETEINGLKILRPLLNCSKQELENYARLNNISYCQDMTNFDTSYTRNYVRHKIMPILDGVNISNMENILSFANYYKQVNDLARRHVIKSAKRLKLSRIDDRVVISYKDFCQYEEIERYFLVSHILNEFFDVFDVSKKAIFNAVAHFGSETKNTSYDLKENIKIIKEYQTLCICKIEKKCYNDKIEIIEQDVIDGFVSNFNDYNIIFNIDFTGDQLGINREDFPLTITTRQPGDRIQLGSVSKKLSRLFIDEKVPKYLRDSLPVIRSAKGYIIGVLGLDKCWQKQKKYDYYIRLLKG